MSEQGRQDSLERMKKEGRWKQEDKDNKGRGQAETSARRVKTDISTEIALKCSRGAR